MKNILSSTLLTISSFFSAMPPLAAEEPAPSKIVAEAEVYPVVIFGGGVGALTSALYLARAGVDPLVLEGNNPGGLLTQSHSVQNWPGEMEIEGAQLTKRMRVQAEASGARIQREEVIGVDFSKRPFTIRTRDVDDPAKVREIRAEVCIIAMGTQPNFLGIPGESGPKGYWGKGVTNCAICDGNLYKDKIVGVVGGGDAAVLEALYLANIAKEVHVFVRKDSFRAIEEKRMQTLLEKPNVKILYNTTVEEIKGNGEILTQVSLKTGSEKPRDFSLDGLFLAIGSTPNSSLFQNILKLDEKGYILLKKDQETSIPGVYAIGDIVDPVYKQAISAAGDGAKAALQAQQFISDRKNRLAAKEKVKAKPTALVQNQVIEISSSEQFQKELESSEIPVVVDFYANWCGPCKRISPLIESSAHQLSGRAKFLKVNVDRFLDLSSTYDVRAMPTVVVLDSKGKVLEKKVGADQIKALLKSLQDQ